MQNRRKQMKWLIALTAISLIPVYGLLGWQTGPHGPNEIWSENVWNIIWTIEAGAWSLRALVEAWALVYLFSTNTADKKSINALRWIEGSLIGLIALTVTLLIVANKGDQSINKLWEPLFWLWALSVASFAPLMFAGVGIAYKAHNEDDVINPSDKILEQIEALQKRINKLEQPSPVEERRQKVTALYGEGLTQAQMATELNVSQGTIYNDIKSLGLNGK